MLPITQTRLPIYHSEQHYPVIVKTEDFPHITGPIVISEERPPLEPPTVIGDNLPVHAEQQSYVEQAEEEASLQEESLDHGVAGHDQEPRILHSQEEVPDTAVHQPDNIDEQAPDEQIQDEQIQEEFQHKQNQGAQLQVEQLQVSDAPLRNHEQFTSEGNVPAEDSSAPWMQESTPVNAQHEDEFYTPNEQVIPQSQAYAQEYQEDFYDESEPWVMVDYPPAEEQDTYFPPEDRAYESQRVELEVASDRYLPQEAEEEADYQYYDDEQRMDNEEVEEPQPAEVCRVDEFGK